MTIKKKHKEVNVYLLQGNLFGNQYNSAEPPMRNGDIVFGPALQSKNRRQNEKLLTGDIDARTGIQIKC